MSGGDNAREAEARARATEVEREGRVSYGTKNIRKLFANAFDDEYYQELKKAGNEWYKPQLDKQYQTSLKQLQAALARNGLGQSSTAVNQEARLKEERGTAEDQTNENILNQVNARKADVANQETIATSQLINTADPSAASAQAQSLIQSQAGRPGWSPLGQVFTDASAWLATQGDLERAGQNRYNVGVGRVGTNARRYLSNISE